MKGKGSEPHGKNNASEVKAFDMNAVCVQQAAVGAANVFSWGENRTPHTGVTYILHC